MAEMQQMAPPPTQAMTADNGTEFLNTCDGLYVVQQHEILEAVSGCETKNRYHVKLIPQGHPIEKEALNPLPDLMTAKEQSECMERICCANLRGLTLPFADGYGNQFFSFQRPFQLTCFCQGCCGCNMQKSTMADRMGNQMVQIDEEARVGWFCTRVFHATPEGYSQPLYTMHVSECGTFEDGTNLCAPTCFNEKFVLDVYKYGAEDASGHTTKITYFWPGCNCAGVMDLAQFAIKFPQGAPRNDRLALVGMAFMSEYAVMEWKKNQNQNNNGGAGGGF